jgi:hypothetical protein
MNTATKKLLKLVAKSATISESVFSPTIETASAFPANGLILNKNSQNLELEVYFMGSVQNKVIDVFPGLKPGKDLYFLLDVPGEKIKYNNNTPPAPNQIGFAEITPTTPKVNNEYTWESVEVINVRSSKTTFEKEDNQFQGSHDFVIKRADGTEISRNNTNTITFEGKKYLRFSYDFTDYSSGIYEFLLDDGTKWKEQFLLDKTGEFKTTERVIIRVPYSDLVQAYNYDFEFDAATKKLKKDDFLILNIDLK